MAKDKSPIHPCAIECGLEAALGQLEERYRSLIAQADKEAGRWVDAPTTAFLARMRSSQYKFVLKDLEGLRPSAAK